MVHLSINEITTFRWSFEEDVREYRAAGVPAIGVWRQKLSDFGEEAGIRLLFESGLHVSNLLWAGGFTGSDGRSFRESVDDASEAIRIAAAMRADCLVVYSGPRAGHTRNHAKRLTCNALREMLPLAEDLDVTLAIEPMHEGCAAEWTYLTDLEETLTLLTALQSQRLKLVFDTYHLGLQAELLSRLPAIAPYIAVVHLADARHEPTGEQDRCRLGDGCIPLETILSTLCNAGYDGYCDVELIGEEIETFDYEDLLRHSQRAFHELVCQ